MMTECMFSARSLKVSMLLNNSLLYYILSDTYLAAVRRKMQHMPIKTYLLALVILIPLLKNNFAKHNKKLNAWRLYSSSIKQDFCRFTLMNVVTKTIN